jgi:UDP-N-acetylmuramate--alanine ligase
MSAVAIALVEMGMVVSGSDARDSEQLDEVNSRGVRTFVGHAADHVAGAEVVLWSPAVAADHVELVAARAAGATLLTRAAVLGELSAQRRVIGLAGTHGKTTATSMMVHVALAAGRDDGWLVGAPVLGVGANGHWGEGDLILEVDESYGTFAELQPYALGLLNVEADHLDHYGSLEGLHAAFVELIERTSGPVVAWSEDAGARELIDVTRKPVTSVGTGSDAAWRVTNVQLARRQATFDVAGPARSLHVQLRVTGQHNVANAAVVAALASALDIEGDAIERGLSNFVGAPRRYQYHGAWRGVDVYEDYAHLPGEIDATLAATRAAGYERITAVFQPHRFTRTVSLADAFGAAFSLARHVIVTDVYSAGEANPTGVTGEVIAAALRQHHPALDVRYVDALEQVVDVVDDVASDSDVVLFLGAGDVASLIATLPGGLR